MPRFYHGGRDAIDPSKFFPEAFEGDDGEEVKKEKNRITEEIRRHHPLSAPHRENISTGADGKLRIKVPAFYCAHDPKTGEVLQQYREWTPGSIAVGFPGYGFHVVPPGGFVDLDPTLPEKCVKASAPHLLTETEYAAQAAAKASSTKPAVTAVAVAPVPAPKKTN